MAHYDIMSSMNLESQIVDPQSDTILTNFFLHEIQILKILRH